MKQVILGALVGDIVGSSYEWHNTKSKDFQLFRKGTHFTDDSVMTLATAKWILNDSSLAPANLIKCMKELGNKYPNAGYGGKFRQWLKDDDPQPYNSWGNGSAMRVSPVGLFASTGAEALALAALSAMPSHNHAEGIKGAQAVALAIYMGKRNLPKEDIKHDISVLFGYDLDIDLDAIRPNYKFDVSCQGSVPIAIKAFLEGNSFEEVLRIAISMGGDSDTIAAMACSIAATKYEIPEHIAKVALSYLTPDLKQINDDFVSRML